MEFVISFVDEDGSVRRGLCNLHEKISRYGRAGGIVRIGDGDESAAFADSTEQVLQGECKSLPAESGLRLPPPQRQRLRT